MSRSAAKRTKEETPDSPRGLRKLHMAKEKSVRSIGILFYFPAILLVHRATLTFGGRMPDTHPLFGLLFMALAASFVYTGYGFRRLEPTFRLRGGILALLGLVLFSVPSLGSFFPAGIAISAYVLFLIFGPAGRRVFSPEYQSAVAATPELKANPPYIVWVAFAGLLIFTAITIAGTH